MKDSDNVAPFHGKNRVFIKRQNAVIGVQKYTRPPKEKKRAKVERGLTEEHRRELDSLVMDWVKTSQKAKTSRDKISYGGAYKMLFLYGLEGKVNGIDQIEDLEFNQAKAYLVQRIKIAEKKIPKYKVIGNSEWRNQTIGAIHARCRNLKTPDETRKTYQRERFKKDSLKDFTDDELQEMYIYVMTATPKFTVPRAQANIIQQDRENALRVLVGVMEANATAKGQQFNPKRLTCSKIDIFELLKQREPELFSGLGEDQFATFWRKQQICKVKSGRVMGSGEQ